MLSVRIVLGKDTRRGSLHVKSLVGDNVVVVNAQRWVPELHSTCKRATFVLLPNAEDSFPASLSLQVQMTLNPLLYKITLDYGRSH
jgi:hypothetical protein